MRRWLGWIAIGCLLILSTLTLAMYGAPKASASLDDRTRAVAQQLRCPVCQSESVADSPSQISKDMRATIRRRLAAGESPDSIKSYFVSRYGNWILLAPPASGVGNLAWLAPPLLLLGGLGLLITLIANWRKRAKTEIPKTGAPYLERVQAELEKG
jgi:cytochrome c-type biogenesis protein CcmH